MLAHRDVAGMLRKHSYVELRKIGEGSFGKALLVQADDGSKLVCKLVDVSQASTKETQDAIKEGRLLAAFKHPYIVRYRENFIDNGWLCILMDYCEGGDLSRQIENAKKQRQPIAENQVLRWMAQALLALKYIHDKHVLHRDLKSSNFFLSRSNNLKMGDFGIAKVLSCTAACARTQIGTPYYLSPEVCQEKPYAWPSDIWAMGCIMYELCERKVPFDASNISGLVQKICRGPTPEIQGRYDDFLKQLCKDMLSRSSSGRPSAETILQRPRMQSIVREMLEEAQQAQENASGTGDSAPAADGRQGRGSAEAAAAAAPGPYADAAGHYSKGDLVDYHSNTHKDWLPATIVNVDAEGRIIIDLKPHTWISVEAQALGVRPRRVSPSAAAGVATPLRQRSPSVGGVGSARGSTPGRDYGGRDFGAPGRANTPSRIRSSSPYCFGGGAPVSRDYSRGPSCGAGSRAGSRASTPSRAASPRGFAHRRNDQQDQARPPGMPRVPGSPLLHRVSPAAAAAGMAIAGV